MEAETLLSLIFQAGGSLKVESGKLLVSPPAIAQRFGETIRQLKPDLLLIAGYCPICVSPLRIEDKPAGRHQFCPQPGNHYDGWFASKGGQIKDFNI